MKDFWIHAIFREPHESCSLHAFLWLFSDLDSFNLQWQQKKGTSEMSNWFVGIMPGSLIPLNCEPLTADIHGCLQKMPRMSDCLWLYFHLRSSLSGCFSSLLKFRFDCLWTTLFLVQLCLQVDSGTKIKHIYSARFQLSLLWTSLLFVFVSSSIRLRI